MKALFFVLCLGLSSHAVANETICTGKVWITIPWAPVALHRDATITISPKIEEAQQEGYAEITVDVGGDPITYKGAVDFQGENDMVMVEPNGDITTFNIAVLSNDRISFKAKFMDPNHKTYGRYIGAKYSCH